MVNSYIWTALFMQLQCTRFLHTDAHTHWCQWANTRGTGTFWAVWGLVSGTWQFDMWTGGGGVELPTPWSENDSPYFQSHSCQYVLIFISFCFIFFRFFLAGRGWCYRFYTTFFQGGAGVTGAKSSHSMGVGQGTQGTCVDILIKKTDLV